MKKIIIIVVGVLLAAGNTGLSAVEPLENSNKEKACQSFSEKNQTSCIDKVSKLDISSQQIEACGSFWWGNQIPCIDRVSKIGISSQQIEACGSFWGPHEMPCLDKVASNSDLTPEAIKSCKGFSYEIKCLDKIIANTSLTPEKIKACDGFTDEMKCLDIAISNPDLTPEKIAACKNFTNNMVCLDKIASNPDIVPEKTAACWKAGKTNEMRCLDASFNPDFTLEDIQTCLEEENELDQMHCFQGNWSWWINKMIENTIPIDL